MSDQLNRQLQTRVVQAAEACRAGQRGDARRIACPSPFEYIFNRAVKSSPVIGRANARSAQYPPFEASFGESLTAGLRSA